MSYAEDVELYETLVANIRAAENELIRRQDELIVFQQSKSVVHEGGVIKDGKGEGKVARCRTGNIRPYRGEWIRPSIEVVRRKKDGTWGSRALHVWGDWTVVSKTEEAAP